MEIDASKLYNVSLEQCMMLQQQIIELKTLYLIEKEENEKLKAILNQSSSDSNMDVNN